MPERRGIDFASLLASIDGTESEVREVAGERAKAAITPIADSLRLSIRARNVMGRRPGEVDETPSTPPEPEKRTDAQGNQIRISREGNDLAANENLEAAWETVLRKRK